MPGHPRAAQGVRHQAGAARRRERAAQEEQSGAGGQRAQTALHCQKVQEQVRGAEAEASEGSNSNRQGETAESPDQHSPTQKLHHQITG